MWNVCLVALKSWTVLVLPQQHHIYRRTKDSVAVCRIITIRHCTLSLRRWISFGVCLAEFLRGHSIVSLALLNSAAISYVAVDLDFLSM